MQVGHHIIAIYDNIDDEINEAFEFLKEGLKRNEAVMILTEDIGKEKLLRRMKENEHELGGNTEELEKRGDVIIESTSGWYFLMAHLLILIEYFQHLSQWLTLPLAMVKKL